MQEDDGELATLSLKETNERLMEASAILDNPRPRVFKPGPEGLIFMLQTNEKFEHGIVRLFQAGCDMELAAHSFLLMARVEECRRFRPEETIWPAAVTRALRCSLPMQRTASKKHCLSALEALETENYERFFPALKRLRESLQEDVVDASDKIEQKFKRTPLEIRQAKGLDLSPGD